MRENHTHGSEGGGAKALPTPIVDGATKVQENSAGRCRRDRLSSDADERCHDVDARDKPGHDAKKEWIRFARNDGISDVRLIGDPREALLAPEHG